MIRRPPRSTQSRSSAASDVYKRQLRAVLTEVSLGGQLVAKGYKLRIMVDGFAPEHPLDVGLRVGDIREVTGVTRSSHHQSKMPEIEAEVDQGKYEIVQFHAPAMNLSLIHI